MQRTILLSLSFLMLAGCATDDPNQRAKVGAAVGAVTGAVLGHQVHDERGRYVGAVAGALAGATVGNYMDRQQRELEAKLAAEREQHQIEVQRLNEQLLKLNLSSEVTFDVDSSVIKTGFKGSLNKVAQVLGDYDKTVVHVIGHTDSTGSESYNQSLSERRASSVRNYLTQNGINGERVLSVGRGELEPAATNQTAEGREMNRRVELFLKPVIEGNEAAAFQAP